MIRNVEMERFTAPCAARPEQTFALPDGQSEELIDDAQEAILSMLGQRTLLQVLTELEIRESAKRTTSKAGGVRLARPGAEITRSSLAHWNSPGSDAEFRFEAPIILVSATTAR
jgi:hypothetical protein